MQKVIPISLVNRRLIAIITALVLVAAFLLVQGFSQRGVAVNAKLAAAAPCDSADIVTQPSSPMQYGSADLHLTVTSTGCTTPEYRFLKLLPGTTTWVLMRGYSTAAYHDFYVNFDTKVGIWQFAVWARQVGSTAKYEAYSIISFTVLSPSCRGAALSASVPSPQAQGTTVTFTAADDKCNNPYFEYWQLPPGSSTWTKIRAYAPGSIGGGQTYVWNTTGYTRGVYRFVVRVKQAQSPSSYESYAMLTYWIT
jgi:hypothetical protein